VIEVTSIFIFKKIKRSFHKLIEKPIMEVYVLRFTIISPIKTIGKTKHHSNGPKSEGGAVKV
jgi:hypothetical protein